MKRIDWSITEKLFGIKRGNDVNPLDNQWGTRSQELGEAHLKDLKGQEGTSESGVYRRVQQRRVRSIQRELHIYKQTS